MVFSAGRLLPRMRWQSGLFQILLSSADLPKKDGDMADDSKRQEANGKFAKLQRTQTAQRATAEYEIEAAALRAKTERLRALRLERDGVAPKPAPGAPKQKSKKRGGGGSLSAFLDGQAKEGRNG
jgi:hypothetical protein